MLQRARGGERNRERDLSAAGSCPGGLQVSIKELHLDILADDRGQTLEPTVMAFLGLLARTWVGKERPGHEQV